MRSLDKDLTCHLVVTASGRNESLNKECFYVESNSMLIRISFVSLINFFTTACSDGSGVSSELVFTLKEMKVKCSDLEQARQGKLFWAKPALDGWGIILISKANEKDKYDLSLISHGHEHVMESRVITCK